jgi:hypothetical protein
VSKEINNINDSDYLKYINSIKVLEDDIKEELFSKHDDEWMAYEPDLRKIISHDVNRDNCLKKAVNNLHKQNLSMDDLHIIVSSRSKVQQSRITINKI